MFLPIHFFSFVLIGKNPTYLDWYFSNNGCGVCVLTSTSPLGPWKSPLNKPLIEVGMAGTDGCFCFSVGIVEFVVGTQEKNFLFFLAKG